LDYFRIRIYTKTVLKSFMTVKHELIDDHLFELNIEYKIIICYRIKYKCTDFAS